MLVIEPSIVLTHEICSYVQWIIQANDNLCSIYDECLASLYFPIQPQKSNW